MHSDYATPAKTAILILTPMQVQGDRPTHSQGNVETPRVGFAAQRVYLPRVSNSVEAAVTAAPSSTAVIARMRILSLSGKVSVLAPDGTSKA